MKKLLACLLALAAIGAWRAQSAEADTMPIAGKVILFGNAGYGYYQMNNLNDDLNAINDTGLLSTNFSKMEGGFNGGGGIEFGLLDFLTIGAEANYLVANTSAKLLGGLDDKLDLPGLETGFMARLIAPFSDSFIMSAGAGIDWYWTWWHSDAAGLVNDFSGNNLGYKIKGGLEAFLAPGVVSLGADVGYRWAKITELKDSDGNTLLSATRDGNLEVDYSGLFILGTLRFYF